MGNITIYARILALACFGAATCAAQDRPIPDNQVPKQVNVIRVSLRESSQKVALVFDISGDKNSLISSSIVSAPPKKDTGWFREGDIRGYLSRDGNGSAIFLGNTQGTPYKGDNSFLLSHQLISIFKPLAGKSEFSEQWQLSTNLIDNRQAGVEKNEIGYYRGNLIRPNK